MVEMAIRMFKLFNFRFWVIQFIKSLTSWIFLVNQPSSTWILGFQVFPDFESFRVWSDLFTAELTV